MVADAVFKFIYRKQKTTCNYSGNGHIHSAEPVLLSFHKSKPNRFPIFSCTDDLLPAHTHSSGCQLLSN